MGILNYIKQRKTTLEKQLSKYEIFTEKWAKYYARINELEQMEIALKFKSINYENVLHNSTLD